MWLCTWEYTNSERRCKSLTKLADSITYCCGNLRDHQSWIELASVYVWNYDNNISCWKLIVLWIVYLYHVSLVMEWPAWHCKMLDEQFKNNLHIINHVFCSSSQITIRDYRTYVQLARKFSKRNQSTHKNTSSINSNTINLHINIVFLN